MGGWVGGWLSYTCLSLFLFLSFTHPPTYLLYLLYLRTGNAAEFCRENMLHSPTLARTLELRKQLCRTLNRHYEGDKTHKTLHVTPQMKPPSPEEEVALRQVSGWVGGWVDESIILLFSHPPTHPHSSCSRAISTKSLVLPLWVLSPWVASCSASVPT